MSSGSLYYIFFYPARDIMYSLQQLYFSAKFLWPLVKVLARWKGLNTLLKKLNRWMIVSLFSSCENVKCMWGGGMVDDICVSPCLLSFLKALCPLPSCLHDQLSLFHPGVSTFLPFCLGRKGCGKWGRKEQKLGPFLVSCTHL